MDPEVHRTHHPEGWAQLRYFLYDGKPIFTVTTSIRSPQQIRPAASGLGCIRWMNIVALSFQLSKVEVNKLRMSSGMK